MTHVSETSLGDAVREALFDAFGVDTIEGQAHLDQTDRFADFIARRSGAQDIVYAVEVENDAESLTTGVGQAQLYAGHFATGVPVVAIPENHVDQPEFDFLRDQTPGVRYLLFETHD